MRCSIVCIIILASSVLKVVESKCGCRVHYKTVGCRKDKRWDRALPELLLTERDRYSPKWNRISVDWAKWDEYLPAFACRCAEEAMKKGYKYFGLQYWGECWSGPSPLADKSYEKHGKGDACYGPDYEKCDPSFDNCVGDNNHNFIYEIVTYNCSVDFERLGCYKDNNRPLDDYILTDRDRWNPVHSGRSIDWINFDTYLPELACRCATKAMEKGYSTFGIQYYGECWSGADADVMYFRDGASSNCVNRCYEPCRNYDPFCTGKGFTNFVYRITSEECEVKHRALGCFKEKNEGRALDELIIDDVHPESSQFMGMVSTDFENWEKYMKGLICRCARKIKEKGYTTFSIHNGGECWSGANAHNSYEKYGSSNECYYDEITPCTSQSTCAGGETTSYVYELISNENNNA